MFLSVRNLEVRVGGRNFAYDFDCKKNERVGILGPTGCGKTTFFRALTGLETARSGSIELDGAEITRVPTNKRRIALMFQDYAIFENISVEKNLKFVLLANRIRMSQWDGMVGEMLDLVGLRDKRKQLGGTLSGGEKQRLALSRCLIIPPKLLLLDEPFNSLDADTKSSVSERLRAVLDRYSITTIAISHDRTELDDLLRCGKIVMMESALKVKDSARRGMGN